MIIDCVSDLHGYYPKLEGGDLLIIAGDLTAHDTKEDYIRFMEWHDPISFLYKKTIMIGGNHDNLVQKYGAAILPSFCEYLCDSGTEFEGLEIWGSPWTAQFQGINPNCCAFTFPFGCDNEEWLSDKFSCIPDDIDILITHGPPLGVLDKTVWGEHVGSRALMSAIESIRPQLHVFGHIHEAYGVDETEWMESGGTTKFVNSSHVNVNYEPVNKPIRIIL